MPTRNPITGDLIQTKTPSKKLLDDLKQSGELKTIEDRRAARGKYKWCKEQQKMIPIQEWNEKYGSVPREKGPMIFVDNFQEYESPIDGTPITNRRKRDYDLKRNGCRPYEGFHIEKQEADAVRQAEDNKLMSDIMETAERTYHEIEHGYRR